MTISNAAIDEAVDQLEGQGYEIRRCSERGYTVLILTAYPLPDGWSKAATDLLLKLPASFPNGAPDMFWTSEDLTLANGAVPVKGDVIELACGRRWRRFSWHPKSWSPATDDIHTFLQFVDRRLAQRR